MNKRQVLASLNKIANELDDKKYYQEANSITNLMIKIASLPDWLNMPDFSAQIRNLHNIGKLIEAIKSYFDNETFNDIVEQHNGFEDNEIGYTVNEETWKLILNDLEETVLDKEKLKESTILEGSKILPNYYQLKTGISEYMQYQYTLTNSLKDESERLRRLTELTKESIPIRTQFKREPNAITKKELQDLLRSIYRLKYPPKNQQDYSKIEEMVNQEIQKEVDFIKKYGPYD